MTEQEIQNMIDRKTRDLKDCDGGDHSRYESLWNERLMLKEMLEEESGRVKNNFK